MGDKNEFVSRWGDTELDMDDKYWGRVPGWIKRNYPFYMYDNQIIGIDYRGQWLIEEIMMFRFDSEQGKAQPSMEELGFLGGRDREAIRLIKKELIRIGAMDVIFDDKRSVSDQYIFPDLVRQCRWWHQFWLKHQPELYQHPAGMMRLKKWLESPEGQDIFKREFDFNPIKQVIVSPLKNQAGYNATPPEKSVPSPLKNQGHRIRIDTEDISDTLVSESADDQTPKDNLNTSKDKTEKVSRRIALPSVVTKTPDQKSGVNMEQKQMSFEQRTLVEWVTEIVRVIQDKNMDLSHLSYRSVVKLYPREIKSAKTMRDLAREIAIMLAQKHNATYAEPDARQIMSDFWGADGRYNGWLFRPNGKNLSASLTFSSETLVNHFGAYLMSQHSVLNKLYVPNEATTSDVPDNVVVTDAIDKTSPYWEILNQLQQKDTESE